MRVLYASRARTTHDVRFAEAWGAAGAEFRMVAASDVPGDTALSSFGARVAAEITEFRPDLIQAGPVTDIADEVVKRWRGPLIIASWGFDLMRDIEVDPYALAQAQRTLVRADAVLVDNIGPRAKAIGLGAKAESIVQFPWGVNLSSLDSSGVDLRGELGWTNDERVILCTRQHEPLYDLPTLITAFATAAQDAPDLRLLMASGGSLTGQLERQLAEAGMLPRTKFVGTVAAPLLPALYRTADLYVSPSPVDGTSVALLEAMACGTPVCVTQIPGNEQWVTPSTGQNFPVGDVRLLALLLSSCTRRTKQTPDISTRAQNALELVQAEADWAQVPAKLRALAELAQSRSEDRLRREGAQ